MNQHLRGLSLKLVPFFFLCLHLSFLARLVSAGPHRPPPCPLSPIRAPNSAFVRVCVVLSLPSVRLRTRLCVAQYLNVLNLKWSSSSFVILYHAPKWNLILLFLTFIVCLHVYVIVPRMGKCPFGWKAGTHTLWVSECVCTCLMCVSFLSPRVGIRQVSDWMSKRERAMTPMPRERVRWESELDAWTG